ncbi:hypothetical protein, partial [uncultured Mucilaginibacter sp.]|uniref:hypothetical protein n=1 Tax=uncultured Mucilaginibacter sp. TaxID=797541 RepID=UPI0025D351C8
MNNQKNKYKYILPIISAVILILTTSSLMIKRTLPKNKKVVFFDDFSGTKLDRSKWNAEVTGMHFNNELQAYVDSEKTIYIVHGAAAQGAKNGALVLQPRSSPGFKTKDGQRYDFI